MASIGNINRGIYLIIDVIDYEMWQALASLPFGSTGRWLTSFHHFQGVPRERVENLLVWRSNK